MIWAIAVFAFILGHARGHWVGYEVGMRDGVEFGERLN